MSHSPCPDCQCYSCQCSNAASTTSDPHNGETLFACLCGLQEWRHRQMPCSKCGYAWSHPPGPPPTTSDLIVNVPLAPDAGFTLVEDNDCHWYVIPASRLVDWSKWLELDSDDEASWDAPGYAVSAGGSPSLVRFSNYVIR